MTVLRISMADTVLQRFGNQLAALGAGKAADAMRRASMHTGAKVRTKVARALVKQTGLKYGTMRRAIHLKAIPGGLGFMLQSKGGDISLKYFRARETRKGVTAAPWNKRTLYESAFIKSGWQWSSRRVVLNGHVFRRLGADRKPIEKLRSGLYIPKEMLEGASRLTFERSLREDLLPRLSHEIGRLLPR